MVLGHGCPRTLTLSPPSFPRPQLSPHWNDQAQTPDTGGCVLRLCSVYFCVWFSLCSVLLVRSASPDPESLTSVAARIPFVLACEQPGPLGSQIRLFLVTPVLWRADQLILVLALRVSTLSLPLQTLHSSSWDCLSSPYRFIRLTP